MSFYVVRKDEHLGPFTVSALKKLYKDGKLKPESLLWKEGMKEPLSFGRIFFKRKATSAKSQLPPLPTVGKDKIVLPPLPGESVQKKSKAIQENKKVEVIKEDPAKKPRWVLYSVVCFIFMMSLGIALYMYGRSLALNSSFARPELMSLSDYNRLKRVSSLNPEKNQFNYALSQDKKSLWIATNSPLHSKVEVKLSSIKERSLGGDISLTAHGELKNNLIELSEFKFSKGTRLVDALYEIEINSYGKDETPFYHEYYHSFSKKINYKSKAFISNFSATEFKKILGKMILKKKRNTLEFWSEIAQKYQTVKVITEQIRKGIETALMGREKNWKLSVLNFENKYKASWGKFFTEFVKANDKSYISYSKKKFENKKKVLAYYNNLSNLAIQIGEESMKTLEDLQAVNYLQLTQAQKDIFKQKTTQALKNIEQNCDEKINEIKAL